MHGEQPLVLVVDDELFALEAMCGFLAEAGYTIARARDGREALELIRDLHPDAVVLDLMLPVISGGRVLAELHRTHNEVPVVLVSGVVKAPAFRERLDFLPKPCDPTSLREAVARAVARAAELRVGAAESR
jgi:CheY-like chemotaxis protein